MSGGPDKPSSGLEDAIRRWFTLWQQGISADAGDVRSESLEQTDDHSERTRALASTAAFLGVSTERMGDQGGHPQGDCESPFLSVTREAVNGLAGEIQSRPSFGSRFLVVRLLAQGGLGNVYVAFDTELGREVALKEIQPRFADDPVSRSRFEREAEVTGRLEHPGVVPVHSLGRQAEGRPYYVMRLIRGATLGKAIATYHERKAREDKAASDQSLALRKLLRRFIDTCNVIDYAHSVGVIHRDIKPTNIMLGPYGETLVVDWGLAGAVERSDRGQETDAFSRISLAREEGLTLPGSTLGTPAFMSPEMAEGGAIGPAADIYCLGATLYCLLTGRPPFQGSETTALLRRVRSGVFPPPRRLSQDCPHGLEAICLKAMARDPAARYPSARSLADDVERWLADEPVSVLRDSMPTRLTRWARGHRTFMTGAAMLLGTAVLALLVGTILIGREQAQTRKALEALLTAQKARELGRVDALLQADAKALPTMIEELSAARDWINPRLRELFQQDLSPEQRRRVRLAMLPFDPDQAEALGRELLDCKLDEFTVIVESLRPHRARLASALWSALRDPAEPVHRRFAAGMALAQFEPAAPGWSGADDEFLATRLLNSNPDDQRDLRSCLKPMAGRLIPLLRKQFGDAAARESVRDAAAQALADYGREAPGLLAELISHSSIDQYPLLLSVIRDQIRIRAEAVGHLKAIAGTAPAGELTESLRVVAGRRRARAAIALVQLDEPLAALGAFQDAGDPEARGQFIHEARERGLKPADLLALLRVASTGRDRFTLLLALGNFQLAEFPEPERSRLKQDVSSQYAHDPSSAIHGAAGWLLRRWGLRREAAAVDRTPVAYAPQSGRSWFVDAIGADYQTFVICPPGTFLMGSLVTETDRDNDERLHSVTLRRPFAIGMHEVTRELFDRYRQAIGTLPKQADAAPDSPAVGVSWFRAVSFCRWLTRQAGLLESDQCYDRPAAEQTGPDDAPRNWSFHPERRGFRLPTEAEWEYACRAGTVTPFSFGSDRRLLSYYGWYQENAGRDPSPWGELRPNCLGLFDLHGNAVEWCHDRYIGYDPEPVRDPIGDPESKYRVYRGGAWTGGARLCRSGDRDLGDPTDRACLGLRLARTLPGR